MARKPPRRVIRELRERQALEAENRLLRDRLAQEEQERQAQRQVACEQQAEEHGPEPPAQDSPDSGEGRGNVNVQVSTPQQWSVGAGIAAAPLVYIAAAIGCPIVGCLALLVIPAMMITLVYVWPIGAAGLATGLLLHSASMRAKDKNLWIALSWIAAVIVCVVIYVVIPPPY